MKNSCNHTTRYRFEENEDYFGDIGTDVEEKRQHGDISQSDKEKIKSLEWLTFYSEQKGGLLAEGKSECMLAVFDIVPADADTLAQIISLFRRLQRLVSTISHSADPQAADTNYNFIEQIVSEHKEQAYRSELNRWKMNLNGQTSVSVTRDALLNIILFPEKGWLDIDTSKSPVDVDKLNWENRLHQLQKLRSMCIPEIVLLLQKALQQSRDYTGCIKLADETSSEARQLYKIYSKHKLTELLSKISESCLTN